MPFGVPGGGPLGLTVDDIGLLGVAGGGPAGVPPHHPSEIGLRGATAFHVFSDFADVCLMVLNRL